MLLAFENPLNNSALAFPVLECFHIAGFALSIGTIAIVDFRLLGYGLTRGSAKELSKDLAPWTLFGLLIMLLTGPMMYSSDPDMYYLNWAFLLKMVFFVLALIFNYTVRRKVVQGDPPPGQAKWVAYLSMILWCGVVFGGIFIGFLNPTLDIRKI